MQASFQVAYLRWFRTLALVVLTQPTMLSAILPNRPRLHAAVRSRTWLSSSRVEPRGSPGNVTSIAQCGGMALPKTAGPSEQLGRKERVSPSILVGALWTPRMIDSTVRKPGQALRAWRAAASVLANTRRRTRRPCVPSKASQPARLAAPTREHCWSKCAATAACARGRRAAYSLDAVNAHDDGHPVPGALPLPDHLGDAFVVFL